MQTYKLADYMSIYKGLSLDLTVIDIDVSLEVQKADNTFPPTVTYSKCLLYYNF